MSDEKRVLADWAADPFRYLIDFLRESADFEDLVSHGLIAADRYPLAEKIVQTIEKSSANAELAPEELSKNQEKLQRLEQLGAKAKAELERGIPLLHAYITVGCWSALEAAISDFAVGWLCHVPETLERQEFSKIRLPVTDYEFRTREERMRRILEEIKRSTSAPLRQGVDQYECILRTIGFDGAVDKEVSRTIFEMSNIRNVIVHRASTVDKRLAEACPWLKLEIGKKLHLKGEDSVRYAKAAGDYAVTVLKRIRLNDAAYKTADE